MRIGLAQITCAPGDIKGNVSKAVSRVAEAAQRGCDLVVLPEMSDTGYDLELVKTAASRWNGGPFGQIQKAARRHRVSVIAGLSERQGHIIHNSVAAFGPEGELLGSYRKTHLFSSEPIFEDKVFTPGEVLSLISINGWSVGLMVCYDLRFPELARALTLKGAELLVVPSAWPSPREGHLELLTRCRALENQLYLACVNQVGSAGGVTFCGSSRIVSPIGDDIAVGPISGETLLTAVLDKREIDKFRERIPTLRHRRPDIYG